jgi:hypothetical protein
MDKTELPSYSLKNPSWGRVRIAENSTCSYRFNSNWKEMMAFYKVSPASENFETSVIFNPYRSGDADLSDSCLSAFPPIMLITR